MDPDCQRRAVTNPLRVFDCKVPEDQPIIEKLPRISQFLDEPCRKHFEQVQEILKSVGVEFQLNDRLVRGLDYYTRTAFEFTQDRKSTRLNSSHGSISYAVFCLKKKKNRRRGRKLHCAARSHGRQRGY